MVAIAAGFAREVARFAGGATAMADSMRPGVEAMQLLRWPAERLDTLGGYLTYHNVTLFTLALTVYAAVQGAHAVRAAEAKGVPAEILATGRSRPGVLLDRAAGLALALALISVGLGAGLAVAMAVGGEPDVGGSFITGFAVGLCAFTGYAVGVLVSQRLGLLTWSAAAAACLALMGWLEPTVADMWNEFQYTQRIFGAESGSSVADQYLAFAGQMILPIATAYVVTQAAGWVNDLKQGRVELVLAAPVSWPRLVGQRVVATLAGVVAVSAAAIAGLTVAATTVGVGVDPIGLARLTAITVLFAAALAAVAALAVAWLRSGAAVSVLSALLAASYLLVYLVPLFAWPEWVLRASVFGAYGNPYLEIPTWTGLAVLAALAVLGGLTAAAVARRSPKVAT
jgi:ABC-2 type transport system permease protein